MKEKQNANRNISFFEQIYPNKYYIPDEIILMITGNKNLNQIRDRKTREKDDGYK